MHTGFFLSFDLGDNFVQNFIWGDTVGNLVLRLSASGDVKHDFQTYIQQYTSPNEHFEHGNPHSNALLQHCLQLVRCKPHNAACHPTKCDIINDVKLLPIL